MVLNSPALAGLLALLPASSLSAPAAAQIRPAASQHAAPIPSTAQTLPSVCTDVTRAGQSTLTSQISAIEEQIRAVGQSIQVLMKERQAIEADLKNEQALLAAADAAQRAAIQKRIQADMAAIGRIDALIVQQQNQIRLGKTKIDQLRACLGATSNTRSVAVRPHG
jgi:hypothetical protein